MKRNLAFPGFEIDWTREGRGGTIRFLEIILPNSKSGPGRQIRCEW